MKTKIISLLSGLAIILLTVTVSFISKTKPDKWQNLFNGRDLNGWKQLGGVAKYTVEDGAIVGTSVKGTPNSFLCTEKMYKDFILEADVKIDAGLNSGIQIRSNSYKEHENGRVHGYQVEIDSKGTGFSGRIWDEARRKKWLDKLKDTAAVRAAFIPAAWNKYHIEVIGNTIKTRVNGVLVANVVDTLTKSGFIGLQVHQVGNDEHKQVRWRNIRIQIK